jgi:hypothetical protein
MTLGLITLTSSAAMAQAVVDDPLHGQICTVAGCATQSAPDNGTITPIDASSLQNGFGWTFSGSGTGQGDLTIALLTPTSVSITGPSLLSGATGNTTIGAFTQVAGTFSSGDLATFLGFSNSSPANPFGGFAVGADAGVTGFNVFTIDVGNLTTPLGSAGDPLTDIFRLANGLPVGVEMVAYLSSTDSHGVTSVVSTALSGDLQVATNTSAVPGPIVGAGLPGLMSALMGMWLLSRSRKQRSLA